MVEAPDTQEQVTTPPKKDAKDNTAILTEVDEIARIDDDEERNKRVSQFIEERKRVLEEDSYKGELSFVNKSTDKFLGKDARVVANFLVDPLVLDDDEIYTAFFDTLREFRTHEGWKNMEIRAVMPHAFQRSIGRYFGGQRVYNGSEATRKGIYFDNAHSESAGISIREFKDKGAAFCAEKASMAHNLYLMLGYDAEIVISNNYKIEGQSEDNHMFNKLNVIGKTLIYDPSNPYEVIDGEGKVFAYYPAIYLLSPEDADRFEKGEKVNVKRPEMQKGADGNLKPISEATWAYGRHI